MCDVPMVNALCSFHVLATYHIRSGTAKATHGPIDAHIAGGVSPNERKRANRLYTIWSAINLRPQNLIHDVGFKLFVGNFAASYITETMHHDTFNSNLADLCDEAKANIMAGIKEQK